MLQLHHAALRIPHRFPPTFRIDDCNVPLGFLGYRMNRTHSIMSIATTASPVSGADARDRKQATFYTEKIHYLAQLIESAWLSYKARKAEEKKAEYDKALPW